MQVVLFMVFLIIYIITPMGNILIIVIITVDAALDTTMYFFIHNLSVIVTCFTLVMVPKMLVNLLARSKTISFVGFGAQMYFFFFFGSTECFLISLMAYDRYVAIFNTLDYPVIMNRRVYLRMTARSWIYGIPASMLQTAWMFSLPFCIPNKVSQFFCDGPLVLKLGTGDTSIHEMQALMSTLFFILLPFSLVLVSYICILATIVEMTSAEGRRKAVSTCSSHLVMVALFYSTAGLTYFRPKSNNSPETKKLVSLSYTVITPMLNPIIYSLRNSEVKGDLRRTFRTARGIKSQSLLSPYTGVTSFRSAAAPFSYWEE